MNRLILILLTALTITACGGGDDTAQTPVPPPVPPPVSTFAAVNQAMDAAYAAQAVPMAITVFDSIGTQVHQYMLGGFSPDRRVAIASASKLVSGVVMFRLIEQNYLSLDSTTGAVLGWSGANSTITLRQLLSFTSGLDPRDSCTGDASVTLAACVQTIAEADVIAPPATRYDYGSTHLHVAARMAEVVTGAEWNAIFAQQLRDPLAISADAQYYTFPRQATGISNPLIAGGLRMTMNEYARVLRVVFDKGQWQGMTLASAALFDEQAKQPYPNVVIGSSPAEGNGFDMKYGLTAWLECDTPATGCSSVSSPGAFGFTPWIDRAAGYYAILGMETTTTQGEVVNWALALEQQVKPLIAAAMAP